MQNKTIEKSYKKLLAGTAFLCALVMSAVYCYVHYYKPRSDLEAMYDGNNKACFHNIVQYRLTDKEVRIILQFMKELRVRPNASALEFADASTIQSINMAYQICHPSVAPVPQVQQK